MLQATRRQTATIKPSTVNAEGIIDIFSYVFFGVAFIVFAVIAFKTVVQLQEKSVINMVQVEGDLRTVDRSQLVAAVRPVVKGNFFTLDLNSIQQSAKTISMIDNVVVSRVWPNGVRIQVRETQPVALWGGGGLLSARGERFIPTQPVSIENLPILSGPISQSVYVMEQYRSMNRILRAIGMHIVELQLTDRMSWFIRLDSGIQLVVDQVDAIEKMQRFAYLYERQLKPDAVNIANIDLRYRNGVAVGWKSAVKPTLTSNRG